MFLVVPGLVCEDLMFNVICENGGVFFKDCGVVCVYVMFEVICDDVSVFFERTGVVC